MTAGVYKITDVNTGEFYIGGSTDIEKRYIKHRSNIKLGQHNNKNFTNDKEFSYSIVLVCEKSKALVRMYEQIVMDALKPTLNLYDFADPKHMTGENNPMKRPEVAAKSSAAKKGVAKTPEHRAKISAARKALGDEHPSKRADVRAKMSAATKAYYAANPDKHPSKRPEVCAKLSATQKAYFAANPDKHPSKRPEVRAKQRAAMKAYWAARRAAKDQSFNPT